MFKKIVNGAPEIEANDEPELEPEEIIFELQRIGNEYTNAFDYEDYFGPLSTERFYCCAASYLADYVREYLAGITASEILEVSKQVDMFLYDMQKCYEFTEKELNYKNTLNAFWTFINNLPVITEEERRYITKQKEELSKALEIAYYGEELPF